MVSAEESLQMDRSTPMAGQGNSGASRIAKLSFRTMRATLTRKTTKSVTPSLREQVAAKLTMFYQKHDRAQLADLDDLVDYALANGIDALNAGLMARYSETLDGSAESVMGATYANLTATNNRSKQDLRIRAELFFAKYDPKKLDKPDDIAAIVEWGLCHGVKALNDRLKGGYSGTLDDVKVNDIEAILQAFYSVHEPTKSAQDIKALAQWAISTGAKTLNDRMKGKYGVGLMSARDELTKEYFMVLFQKFYQIHEPSKLINSDIQIIVDWTMEHGIDAVNTKLRKKYKGNDLKAFEREYSVRNGTSAYQHQKGHVAGQLSQLSDRSSGSSMPSTAAAPDSSATRTRMTALLRMFCSKHDSDKLMNEGVSSMVQWAEGHGNVELNRYLEKEYKVTLKSVEEFYDNITASLHVFLRYYDPTLSGVRTVLDNNNGDNANKGASRQLVLFGDEAASDSVLAGDSLHALVSWAYIHGEEALNAKLLAQYDDDLKGRGLYVRLGKFFDSVEKGNEKPEEDIVELLRWTLKNGVEALNGNLKERYARDLNDVMVNQEFTGPVKQDQHKKSRRRPSVAVKAMQRLSSSTMDVSTLSSRVEAFFLKNDPSELSTSDAVAKRVEWILRNGIDAFNEALLQQYGETLNSFKAGGDQVQRPYSFLQTSSQKQQTPDALRTRSARPSSDDIEF